MSHGFSPEEIAEKLHMTKSNLQKIERDEIEISRENLDILLQTYNITYEELQNFEGYNIEYSRNKIDKLWSAYSQTFQETNEELKEVFNKRITELKESHEKLYEAQRQTIATQAQIIEILRNENRSSHKKER